MTPADPAATDTPHASRWEVMTFTVLVAITPAVPTIAVAGSPVDLSDIPPLAAALVGLIALGRHRLWRSVRLRRFPEAWALMVVALFTLVAAARIGSVHAVFVGPARWAFTAVMVLLAYLLIRTRADALRLLGALVLVGAFEAIVGLAALIAQWSPRDGLIGATITPGNMGSIGWMRIYGRITGTTGMAATFLAGFLALVLPVAVALVMTATHRRRTWWIVATTLVALGLVFTLSRVPIGLAGIAVVALVVSTTRRSIWLPFVLASAALFLLTPLRDRLTNFTTDRVDLWRTGWRVFLDHPWFGVGPGRYLHILPAYVDPDSPLATTPHNSLLYLAAESGLLAAVALAVAIGLSLRYLPSREPVALGAMLGLFAFALNAMTTNLYSIPSIALAAWMMAPCVRALRRDGDEHPRPQGTGRYHDRRRTPDGVDPTVPAPPENPPDQRRVV